MPLGDKVSAALDVVPTPPSNTVVTAEVKSKWIDIIDNGGLESLDSATLVDPDTSITNSTTHIFVTGGRGTRLALRMKYDDGITLSTDPVCRVFGRHSSGDSGWTVLYSEHATPAVSVTFPEVSTDVTDATDQWSDWLLPANTHIWKTYGFDEFIVGVTAVAVAGVGDATLTTLEAKVF